MAEVHHQEEPVVMEHAPTMDDVSDDEEAVDVGDEENPDE